jgi:predicted ATP-grasp superfamily ATP-dependent carboligase
MAEPERPTILVTDAGRGSALAIIRSLGRRGWRVIAADADPRSLGFRSHYAREKLCYPCPETTPRAFVSALLTAARNQRVDLILPVTDAAILPLSAARVRFENVCQLVLPDAAALEVVTNKRKTLDLAERLGVPAPRTRVVHSVSEATEHAQALGWPVVLKPQASRLYNKQAVESFGVCYAECEARLAERMKGFEGRCPVLLQEYCSGVGYGVELLTYEGRPLAALQHRRLREIPVSGGASAFRESVPLDPTLYRYAVQMLQALRWTGLAMVEFKVGAQGPRLMEINGRVWGSLPLAVRSGMDFPARLVDLWLSGPPSPETPADTCYKIGVRARNLELDLLWIAQVLLGKQRYPFLPIPGRLAAIATLLGMFNPKNKLDVFTLEDPWPAGAELFKILETFRGKLREARQA